MSDITIRAWTSKNGWYVASDPRLRFEKSFRKYGIRAKIAYLYAKLFYQRVVIDTEEEGEDD